MRESEELVPVIDQTASGFQQSPALPLTLRLLCVSPVEPDWIPLTLALAQCGCESPELRWVPGAHEALLVLREQHFDCVAIGIPSSRKEQTSGCNPLSLVRAIRSSGNHDPIVVLTTEPDDQLSIEMLSEHCELLVSPNLWESNALVPMVCHAIAKSELERENYHLSITNKRRLVRERDETNHLLKQQQEILAEVESLCRSDSFADVTNSISVLSYHGKSSIDENSQFPETIREFYNELLRSHIIMGSGSLGPEIAKLARLITDANLTARETLKLHLESVETMVRGLGNRSARHVVGRADLLALELMVHLAELYQNKTSS